MSVGMSLLAILDEGPAYGLQLRDEFEGRTGSIYPLNPGQVYSTLGRLERDGLVRELGNDGDREVVYQITAAGRRTLKSWFAEPTAEGAPSRDELVLKIVMAAARDGSAQAVIQAERKAAVQTLQSYTRLKREAPAEADLGWLFLLDSLIFQTEARVRWLDACEARLGRAGPRRRARRAAEPVRKEVRR